jgi:AbrB family looped-hinge helix DNA binding protein
VPFRLSWRRSSGLPYGAGRYCRVWPRVNRAGEPRADRSGPADALAKVGGIGYDIVMDTTVTLDEAGRVAIPQELRDRLHLDAGTTLALHSEGERIILCPVQTVASMQQEHGVWVFRIGEKLPASAADETLDHVRRERDLMQDGERTRKRSSTLQCWSPSAMAITSITMPALKPS